MNNVEKQCALARQGAIRLATTKTSIKNEALAAIAKAITADSQFILEQNEIDLRAFSSENKSMVDRLTLTKERIEAMAKGVESVVELPDPVGETIEEFSASKGIRVKKTRVPLGVIGVIYEARPNVTADVAALTLKSGNAVVLRGGKEAINTNRAIFGSIKRALDGVQAGLSDAVQFLDDVTRESTAQLIAADKFVDVIIPRGGEGLKNYILANSKIPVIASAGGRCHVYVDKTADLKKALAIVENAKLQRPSVCNAMECLIVDKEIATEFLSVLLPDMIAKKGLEAFGNEESASYSPLIKAVDDGVYDNEYLDYKMSVKVVDGVEEAITHINAHGTRHSEAIISSDEKAIAKFTSEVDAACVYVNASTRFTDGFEFGFGAEIAISTQKLHARGPLGLRELTTYKYVICGDGQTRD